MNLPPIETVPPSGDNGFERHYHAGSQEVPGAAADSAVLALARAATASPLRASAGTGETGQGAHPWSRRWQAPLALAACLVLAVGVVTRMQTQLPDVAGAADSVANQASSPPASPAPPPAAEPAPVVAAFPAVPRPEPASMQPALTASAEKTGDARRTTPPAAEAMSAPGAPSVAAPNPAPAGNLAVQRNQQVPQAAASAATQDAGVGSEMQATTRMAARKAGVTPGAADAGITAAEESTLAPQAWLARIAELRGNGRLVEADASLKRFRERHPSVQVPPAASGQPE